MRPFAQVSAICMALLITACQTDGPLKPVIPELIPASQFRPMAFIANVDMRNGRITITAPADKGPVTPTLALDGPDGVSLSLLGGDAIRLLPTNYLASPVGTFAPGKIRVTFDVVIENKLPYVALTTPTWPEPPASGVILFPLDFMARLAPGDTSGGQDSLVAIPPNSGMVTPSIEWNGTGAVGSGAPFSFFNDIGCTGITSDECFRWIAYETRVEPTSRSSVHTVGFDIDATIVSFSARMIVAGDLVAATPPAQSSILGSRTPVAQHH